MASIAKVLKPLELTLAILKPDVCRNPMNLQAIHQIILDNNFYFVRTRMMAMTVKDAERFYSEHKDRFFYNRLVSFMSSGLISVHILARENAIQHWRKLMGPTKVYRAQYEAPESIRGRFGLTDTRNATHGSDSATSAHREIAFFFPEFSITSWYQIDEPNYRNGDVKFLPDELIHVIRKQ